MGGKVRMYDPSTAEGWKSQIAAACKEFEGASLEIPLHLSLDFLLARPKSHFRTGLKSDQLRRDAPHWSVGKPDVDNYAKAVMDALTQIGVWKDDSYISSLTVTKSFKSPGGMTGCAVMIRQAHNF